MKDKNKADHQHGTDSSHSDLPPADNQEATRGANEDDSDSAGDDALHPADEAWALDDATEKLAPTDYDLTEHEEHAPAPVDDVVQRFLQTHAIQQKFDHRPIPAPVIIPQRRPRDKTRGFVHAYAPVLGECSGIDQETFIDFIQDFYKASLASPVFDVINMAGIVVGFVPNPITMGVSIATQAVAQTGREIQVNTDPIPREEICSLFMQSRVRRNTYLDQMNEALFKPRGLFAMIMTFKTDSESPLLSFDTSSSSIALYKSLNTPDAKWKQNLRNLRLAAGTSKSEASLPEPAPLIFPVIDEAAASAATSLDPKDPSASDPSLRPQPTKSHSTKETLHNAGQAMTDYLDRRARGVYDSANPNSHLAVPHNPSEHQYASRFSDPNHPANSGSIVALITGGRFDPQRGQRIRKAERRAWRHGYQLNEAEVEQAAMNRRLPRRRIDGTMKPKGLIARAFHQDILYLMICNMPSESELREYQQALEPDKMHQTQSG